MRNYCRWKSRAKGGRPPVGPEVVALIRRMSAENVLWGAPRIRSELALLGHEVAESTVAKHMAKPKDRKPSQTWHTFLRDHMGVARNVVVPAEGVVAVDVTVDQVVVVSRVEGHSGGTPLPQGDVVVRWDGKDVQSVEECTRCDGPILVKVQRNGTMLDLWLSNGGPHPAVLGLEYRVAR